MTEEQKRKDDKEDEAPTDAEKRFWAVPIGVGLGCIISVGVLVLLSTSSGDPRDGEILIFFTPCAVVIGALVGGGLGALFRELFLN